MNANSKRIFSKKRCLFLATLFMFAAYIFHQTIIRTRGPNTEAGSQGEWRVDKVNTTSGKFLPFYGYTIISKVSQNLSQIEEFIRGTKFLSKFVTPMYSFSYHVSYFDIFTQRNIPSRYRSTSSTIPSIDWLDSFRLLRSDMLEAQSKCRWMKDANVTFKKTSYQLFQKAGRGLIIRVKLSHEPDVEHLRTIFESIFGFKKPLEFHMTLGYVYKTVQDQDLVCLTPELDQLWSLLGEIYTLQPPSVYYFESMKEFLPVTRYFSQL